MRACSTGVFRSYLLPWASRYTILDPRVAAWKGVP
jgi:hypothetical protein